MDEGEKLPHLARLAISFVSHATTSTSIVQPPATAPHPYAAVSPGQVAPLHEARYGHGAVSAHRSLYVLGGEAREGELACLNVEHYSVEGDVWAIIPEMALPAPRKNLGVTFDDHYLYIVGGKMSDLELASAEGGIPSVRSVDAYSPDEKPDKTAMRWALFPPLLATPQWAPIASMHARRDQLCVVAIRPEPHVHAQAAT